MAPRKYLKEAALVHARLARNAKSELQATINTQSCTNLNPLVIEILSSGSESGYYGGVNTIRHHGT
jgi:hypothetical protein